ncbi:phosphatidylserine/phosphatidylglycerophosphate/cardiolipin synthase family protein [Sphingobium cupriresistens]|uniref:Phospholipase D n=2 Tax=Sphingobium cupriresistens TaxID=1132417 RepID=A0A8G1ZFQ8_9SPHN|nr:MULTISPECIES: phosphatidylserine/phosphatidylglycerophosphate/cardiolipin synthase family protein [Sphingobium]MBJ7375716.1 phosphatidylserine/phosphatidylglycerophosphate/cardiolipin synthase family protein [Sphingobium sp.]RYM10526.1 phosphatidylserine/phosphatidylglycerophosphate/cardiolipin synthase family protein [Sphingobium cupriresistens]
MARDGQNGHEGHMATIKPAPDCATTDDIRLDLHGNHLRLIADGPALRDALIALIDGAHHSLKLYYYIFAADGSGTLVRDALIAARARGVAVTLMIDGFGSAATPDAFFAPLIEAGAQFARFGTSRSTRYLIRNHQKMAIADDERLMIGGFNVEDGYFGIPTEDCWRDIGLLIVGDQVEAMTRWYGQLWRWSLTKRHRFRTLRRMVRQWHPTLHHHAADPFRWLIGGPTRRLSPWAQVVKHDLEKAGRVDMIAAYFSPGRGMLKRIARAARRKGARIILPARSDNGATVAAARLLYGPLLRRGVEIYEYQPCKLHMKLIVIDDGVYVGSANFDMRSLFINLEVMLRVEDAGFAQEVRQFILREATRSRAISLEAHRSGRSGLTLLKQWISYLLVGVLDYTVTRRLNFRDPDAD